MDYRISEVLEMIPKDVLSVLDVGSQGDLYSNFDTIAVDYSKARIGPARKQEQSGNSCKYINQDLNKNQKLDIKDNSVDLVVLSQILEHLVNVEEIISESKRISRKYILIGLPNEVRLDSRIKILFGRFPQFPEAKYGVYYPFGHKHFFTIKTAERFVRGFFGNPIKTKYIFGSPGGRFLPNWLKRFLAYVFPTFFAGEVYYLIRINKLDFKYNPLISSKT